MQFRCLFLARCYTPLKRYAEALTLINHGHIHMRETTSTLSLVVSDPISAAVPCFFPLSNDQVKDLENSLVSDSLQLKRDWFLYNGGSADADGKTYEKPLFFNIALNYVELDMDRLLERAGKQPVAPPTPLQAKPEPIAEKKPSVKAKVEVRPATPEPQASSRGGLSNLLGGWWGKS